MYSMSYFMFPILPILCFSYYPWSCVAVYTLAQVFGVEGELSGIARQGSGSACRSMYGGFVQWIMGQQDDGKDSVAQQVEPETHWPELRILVLVVGLRVCESEWKWQSETKRMKQNFKPLYSSVKVAQLMAYFCIWLLYNLL